MSVPLQFCTKDFSNVEIISAHANAGILDAQEKDLLSQMQHVQMMRSISRQVTHVERGVPLQYTKTVINAGATTTHTFCNVTPSKNQSLSERKVIFTLNKGVSSNRIHFYQSSPYIETMSTLIDFSKTSLDLIQEIAFDFIITGKFPQLNKLTCQLSQEKNK